MNPSIEIRLAGQDDLEWAARLMASSEPWLTLGLGLEQTLAACLHPEYSTLIAYSGDHRLGLLRLHPRGVAGSPYIASVAVDEAARGRGVGSLLVEEAERRFASAARYIFLCVSSFNTRARALYERRGYRFAAELEHYVVDGHSEILMSKRIR